MMNSDKAKILLADGTIIEGDSFGAQLDENNLPIISFAEIVFNTSMVGYQEILTDPSYASQAVVMTYPEIGNYGINDDDFENDKGIFLKGIIVKSYCKSESHYKSKKSLSKYLKENNIIGIENIDTRNLTKKIASIGSMPCVLTTGEITDDIKQQLADFVFPEDVVKQVSVKDIKRIKGDGANIALIDLGCKKSIINEFKKRKCNLTIYPYNISSGELLSKGYDAIFLSNGPGDPQDVKETINTVKELIGKIPIYGICLGYQILSIALGASTYKLKFGHRGANHPIMNLETDKVIMSSQNHSYAVDKENLPKGFIPTYINLNDGTLEGFKNVDLKIDAVQFHPEAACGPCDAKSIFDSWVDKIKEDKKLCQKN